MRPWTRVRPGRAAIGLLLAGCASAGRTPPPVPEQPAAPAPAAAEAAAPTLAAEAAAARAVVEAFVAAEARHDAAGDTLLATGAEFIMGGIIVTRRPRLAAFVGRGEAAVEEARVGLAGGLAWVVVVYRFDSPSPGLRDRARGTFVLERRTAGWRIRHVHTSMVERW